MTLRALLSASALIMTGLLVGRVLGLLREMLIAANFGTGHHADLAIALLLIPDFITNVMIGSAASAALIPAFAARDEERALALFWQSLFVSFCTFLAITLLLVGLVPFSEEPKAFYIALAALPLTAATSVITAYLQHRGRFLVPAFSNVIFNGVIILTLWLMPEGLVMLACGIIAAGLLRVFAHFAAFLRTGARWPQTFAPWELRSPLLRAYVATAGTGMFGLLPQYVPYAVIALVGASVATFNYAFKLVLLPAILGQTLIQMVLLPWLVRLRKIAGPEEMSATYSLTLQCAWIITLCLCLALSLASYPIAELCFGYGKMTEEGIANVASLFSLGLWAMPPIALASVWQQILYASERTGAALVASMLQAALVVPLCWLGQELYATPGVVLAFVGVQVLPVVFLARHGYKLGISRRGWPSAAYLTMTLASVAVFIPLAGLYNYLSLSGLAAIVAAVFIGIASLAAGLAVSATVRARIQRT